MPDKLLPEETRVIDESPEISVGERPGWLRAISQSFPALKNPNYKLYFFGQLISLIGTWLQIVAQGWLVLKLTNSAFLIGLVAALATLPSFLFTLFGGVIVDWFSKKRILLFTQGSSMILAFVLGALTLAHIINIWEIGMLSFLLGVVNAIDAPARQAFVPEMVTKDELTSAIALNSGVFNTARVIGPGVAGLLIAVVGTGGAFMLNGLSYIAVIIALLIMKLKPRKATVKGDALKAIKEGFAYSLAHPIIRTLILFTAVSSVFGWSYTTIMPLIAQNEFHLGADGLGYLYAATGLGALMATFLIAGFSKRVPPIIYIAGGSMLFAVSLILFSYTTNFYLALILLFFAGLGLLSQFAMMNTRIQSLVKSEFRGRVMSIYVFMFVGLTPIGNFEIGWLSERTNTSFAIRVGAIIVFVFAFIVFLRRNKITAAFNEYSKENT